MIRSFESAMREWHDAPSFVVFVIVVSAVVSQILFGIIGLTFGLPNIGYSLGDIGFPSTEGLSQQMDRLDPLFDRVGHLVDRLISTF